MIPGVIKKVLTSNKPLQGPLIQAKFSVVRATVYDVEIKLLQTDLSNNGEYASSIKFWDDNANRPLLEYGSCKTSSNEECTCVYRPCSKSRQKKVTAVKTFLNLDVQFTRYVGSCGVGKNCKVGYPNKKEVLAAVQMTLTPCG